MTLAAPRDGYGNALLKLAKNPKVVVLEADLGKSTKSCWFRKEYPERTFCVGISEQNMVLVAAGLASSGYIPFASTFAIFSERAFEQMRNGVCRPELNVHLCGSHGGMHTGEDGSSAQSVEDLAIFRSLPNMTVIHPADDISAEQLTIQLSEHCSPSYMRTTRNKVPRLYEDKIEQLQIGKGVVHKEGGDVVIFACGIMVARSLEAAEKLAKENIHATVVDMHTIKPLDEKLVVDKAKSCGCAVTVEDHSVIGGLGGAISECLTSKYPVPIENVGVKDKYGQSGKPEELMELMNLTVNDIVRSAKKSIERRS